jgi:hypothetical protein
MPPDEAADFIEEFLTNGGGSDYATTSLLLAQLMIYQANGDISDSEFETIINNIDDSNNTAVTSFLAGYPLKDLIDNGDVRLRVANSWKANIMGITNLLETEIDSTINNIIDGFPISAAPQSSVQQQQPSVQQLLEAQQGLDSFVSSTYPQQYPPQGYAPPFQQGYAPPFQQGYQQSYPLQFGNANAFNSPSGMFGAFGMMPGVGTVGMPQVAAYPSADTLFLRGLVQGLSMGAGLGGNPMQQMTMQPQMMPAQMMPQAATTTTLNLF